MRTLSKNRKAHRRARNLFLLVCLHSLVLSLYAADAPPAVAPAAAVKPVPHWVALWQDAYTAMPDPNFDPERVSAEVAVDRTTGEAFLSCWNIGVWKSSDAGKTFARVDGGKISGNGCGPLWGNSFTISPEGQCLATFNMNNGPGPSGSSSDGGKTWNAFTSVGRNWDIGAIDWNSKIVLGARHEEVGLHYSTDAGQTWVQLARTRTDPWLTGLGVLDKILFIATEDRIERSEDAGKTWTKVADDGAVGPLLTFKGKAWWLSAGADPRILTSADQGKTWQVQGVAAPARAPLGPFFGKDENHIVIAGKDGFYETTDGAKTWQLAVALPDDFALGGGMQSAAYDPVHDIFYATNPDHSVMKFARGAAPDYATAALPNLPAGSLPAEAAPPADATPPSAAPATPDYTPVQFIQKARAKVRVFVNRAIALHGDYLYQAGEDGLMYFKRDAQSGQLHFVEQQLEEKSGGFSIATAGDHLYAVTSHDGYHRIKWHGLAWYDFDPETGKPVKKGVVDCPGSLQMLVGPEQHDLYLKESRGKFDHIFWYQLAADGTPSKAGDVTGKGIGPSVHTDYPGLMQMTADGKFIYAVSATDYAIACIARKATGELTYVNAVSLDAVAKQIPGNAAYLWTSLGLSPDGQWLYAAVRNGKPTENCYAIFKRDPDTGALTFQETISGETDALANQKGWNMVFAANGQGGYLGSFAAPLITFAYDAKTGHLTHPALVKETKGSGSSLITAEPSKDWLYVAGREYRFDGLFTLRTAKK